MSEPKKNPKTGKWDFVIDLPSANGRRRQAYRRGFTTKKEARDAQHALLAEAAHGTVVDPSRLIYGDYLTDQWLPALEGRNLRPSTIGNYGQIVRTHLVPRLGTIRLQALDAAAVERLLAALAAAGRSPKTRRNVAGVVSKSLADALRWQLVGKNVLTGVLELPRVERTRPRAWSSAQTKRFLAHVAEERLAPLWRFIAVTGTRRGEALGLHWTDVDLDAGVATIARTRVLTGSGVIEGPTKTSAGARTIALDPGTVEVLRVWRRAQREEYVRLGIRPDHDLVFTGVRGQGLWPTHVTTGFAKLCDRLELPRIGVHGLRHSAATWLMGAGVSPKLVSQRLGHANVSLTLAVYSHVMPGHDQAAAAAYAGALDFRDHDVITETDQGS